MRESTELHMYFLNFMHTMSLQARRATPTDYTSATLSAV